MSPKAARLGRVVAQMIAYRGWKSPEAFDQSYRPAKAPVGGATIRRIATGKYEAIDTEEGQLTLMRLAGMLRIPPTALTLIHKGDRDGVERLAFEDDALRQFVLDHMDTPGRARRSS